MNDMLALATSYIALIALLIGHSIQTSRRLKLVEERLAVALEANERREKNRNNSNPEQIELTKNNDDFQEE